ncbi:MAG: hypothetical protein CSA18_05305 [Deltaproteobacteria bacterium]|nr:MAG: hypothetical protein CSA18_05305 [Deltaproteobacteria bacterium]
MNVVLKNNYISESEYLAISDECSERLELINGEIYAMSGGSGEHNTITMNLSGLLWSFLKGKSCRAFSENMRVKVSDDNIFYPDVLVDCNYDPNNPLFAGSPVLIIEVLSPSTADYDRGTKFNMYRQIASLEEYVIIEQKKMNVKIYRRINNWKPTHYRKGDDVEFQSIGLTEY